jgi:hypothetical protein
MIVAVDFDGTLALGNSEYISTLAPNRALIKRLQNLRAATNPTIKIVTARGDKDRLSDSDKRTRYHKTIAEWLRKYEVPFDSISFKKEYANLYIDDQTIGPNDDFISEISAFTGNKVILTEHTAVKFSESAPFEYNWYKEANMRGIVTPEVLFANNECIITQRIYPTEKVNGAQMIHILERFSQIFSTIRKDDYQTYLDNLPKDVKDATDKTLECIAALANMDHPATFFHGDLSTTNVLIAENIAYLIDPNVKHVFGSYLTDAGKAVFSIIAYEAKFPEAQKIVDRFGPEVWYFAVAEGLRVCKYAPKYISIVNNIADLI